MQTAREKLQPSPLKKLILFSDRDPVTWAQRSYFADLPNVIGDARIGVLVIVLTTVLFAGGNTRIRAFNRAKKLILGVTSDEGRTLYCGCRYTGKVVDRESCGYMPRRDNARAQRIEIEHVVPSENFGRSFIEWHEGHADCVKKDGTAFKGRRCTGKTNETYRLIEADLYNLFPEIGELNADRSNFRYGMIEGEERVYGSCDFEVEDRVVEPREEIRGDIARVYFYMDTAYPNRGILGNASRRLFEAWDKEYPVDAAECTRARKIEIVQGNANDFVKNACRDAGMYEVD